MDESKDTDWQIEQKTKPISVLYQETHLTCKDTQRLKVKGWRKIYQANGEQKKSRSCNSHL